MPPLLPPSRPMDGHQPVMEYPGYAPSEFSPGENRESISLSRLLNIVRRHFRLVLGLAFVGTLAGGALAYREPSSFRALATVRLANERRAMTGETRDGPTALGRTADPLLTVIQLVRSRAVLGDVVDSLNLRVKSATPGFGPAMLTGLRLSPRAPSDSIALLFRPDGFSAELGGRVQTAAYGGTVEFGSVRFGVATRPRVGQAILSIVPREQAIDGLAGGLQVSQRPGTDVVDIAYVTTDPARAQRIVNMVVESYQSISAMTAKDRSRRRREFLDEQLRQTDSMLNQAQAQLSTFRSRQQLASSQDRLNAEQTALMALESRRAELEADRRTFDTLLRQLSTGSEADRDAALRALATSPAIAENATVGGLYQQLAVYQDRLDSMTTGPFRSSPKNPDVVQLKGMIGSSTKRLVDAARSQVASLDAKIQSLGALRARGASSMSTLPAMAEEEARLSRRVDALANSQNSLRQDYHLARMSEAVEVGDVDVVDLADQPYVPVLKGSALKLGLGFALGLLLGLGGAFLIEATNTSVRRPEDLQLMLPVPGLAVIPRLTASGTSGRPKLGRLLTKGSGNGNGTNEDRPAALKSMNQPFSVGTEAFRMLRTGLAWTDPSQALRTLVVTSAGPGEGKTLTAANLAVTFAYDGLRVLLIDCDVRRPRLHGMFHVPRSPGLMELLETPSDVATPGVGSHSADLDTLGPNEQTAVIRATSIRGLSLLTCGVLPTNSASLLNAARMRHLLHTLQRNYDMIVLDTPPVLATADAGILAAISDGVLLVARAGQTNRGAAQRAYQQLVHAGAHIVGTVLNDPGGEVAHYGDYYYPYDYAAERE